MTATVTDGRGSVLIGSHYDCPFACLAEQHPQFSPLRGRNAEPPST